MSGRSRTVVCSANVSIAEFLFHKQEEFSSEKPKLLKCLDTAFKSLCDHPTAVSNLHDAKQVKNIGPWILRMLKEFFDGKGASDALPGPSSQDPAGGREKPKRRYCPKIHSAAYALLITLHKAHQSGKPFMLKKDLIDATDVGGLSEKPIRPNPISFNGGNSRDWYSGWNSMKTLTEKCLVVKTSNPGKYKLTDEGRSTAEECLQRANQTGGSRQDLGSSSTVPRPHAGESDDADSARQEDESDSDEDITEIRRLHLRQQNNALFSSQQMGRDGGPNFVSSQRFHTSALPPAVRRKDSSATTPVVDLSRSDCPSGALPESSANVFGMASAEKSIRHPQEEFCVPPLKSGEKLSDLYDIICILDSREKFRMRSSTSTLLVRFAESLATQFKVKVEVRHIPVGDAMWIARHKQQAEEYVLDFVVERKQVADLWQSIKDNRYKQQKLRLISCGLKKLLYLVEGDVNSIEATDSLKTSIFTTELHGGFQMLRTADANDTSRQYGYLTLAITNRYNLEVGKGGVSGPFCKTYKEFLEHCRDLDRDRVTDVFCLQLSQISHVTEDVALSIQDQYPTLFSLTQAYAKLEGNDGAQEKLLQGLPIRNSVKTISALISRNVYKLIWAP